MFLEHINLTVANLDRSIDFYCSLLDLQVRWRRGTGHPDGAPAAHVGDERCYIALFQASPDSPVIPPKPYEHVGFNHLGFVVDDLDATRQRLMELGITPGSEAEYHPGRRLYFRDQDGIEVELVQYTPDEQRLQARAIPAM